MAADLDAVGQAVDDFGHGLEHRSRYRASAWRCPAGTWAARPGRRAGCAGPPASGRRSPAGTARRCRACPASPDGWLRRRSRIARSRPRAWRVRDGRRCGPARRGPCPAPWCCRRWPWRFWRMGADRTARAGSASGRRDMVPPARGAGRPEHRAAQHATGAARGLGYALGREIVGDAALLLGRGGVDQPHQQEEGHHRRHEVGIGHFPGAAVMAAMAALLYALDDDGVVARHARTPSAITRGGSWRRAFPGGGPRLISGAPACAHRLNQGLIRAGLIRKLADGRQARVSAGSGLLSHRGGRGHGPAGGQAPDGDHGEFLYLGVARAAAGVCGAWTGIRTAIRSSPRRRRLRDLGAGHRA